MAYRRRGRWFITSSVSIIHDASSATGTKKRHDSRVVRTLSSASRLHLGSELWPQCVPEVSPRGLLPERGREIPRNALALGGFREARVPPSPFSVMVLMTLGQGSQHTHTLLQPVSACGAGHRDPQGTLRRPRQEVTGRHTPGDGDSGDGETQRPGASAHV